MDNDFCAVYECKKPALKYCFDCKKLLCKQHRIEDQNNHRTPEHIYIDVETYRRDPQIYAAVFCEEHTGNLTISECVNCRKSCCSECSSSFCPRAAGRYHDVDSFEDIAEISKQTLNGIRERLNDKHNHLMYILKQACRTLEDAELKCNLMLQEVDSVAESQITAIREKAGKVKEEIQEQTSHIRTRIRQNIQQTEQLELKFRHLLNSLHEISNMNLSMVTVRKYRETQEEIASALEIHVDECEEPSMQLIHKGTCWSMEVVQQKKVDMHGFNPSGLKILDPPIERKPKLDYTSTHRAINQAYDIIRYVSSNTIIASGYYWQSSKSSSVFIEIIKGQESKYQTFLNSYVHQIIPFKNNFLVVTSDKATLDVATRAYNVSLYSCRLRPLGNIYEYADEYHQGLVGVTSDSQLLVLKKISKRLIVYSMAAKESTTINLTGLIVGPQQLLVISDADVVITDVDHRPYQSHRKHSVIKYNLKAGKVIWKTEFSESTLYVTQYADIIYVYAAEAHTVRLLQLSDGGLVQSFNFSHFPKNTKSITQRKDSVAVADWNDGIKFFSFVKDGML